MRFDNTLFCLKFMFVCVRVYNVYVCLKLAWAEAQFVYSPTYQYRKFYFSFERSLSLTLAYFYKKRKTHDTPREYALIAFNPFDIWTQFPNGRFRIMSHSSSPLSWRASGDGPIWNESHANLRDLDNFLSSISMDVSFYRLTFKSMTDVNVIRHGKHLKIFSCFSLAWCDWIWLTVLNILWHGPHWINFSMCVCRCLYKIVLDLNSLLQTLQIGILPGVFWNEPQN